MFKNLSKVLAPLCFGIVAALVAGAASAADDYPSKPVRIIVPYTPGGFNDTLARTVGDRLSKVWKQSVIVDNRPGGNTVLGNNLAAKAPADGYTMLITPLPFSALPALYGGKLPYDAVKDFTPLVWAGSTQNALVVRNDLGVNNVRELIDYAKKNPGKLNFGSTGSGSSNHLSMELFMSMTGTRMTHVPYKGSAPAVMGMLGSEIDVLFDNVPNLMQQIKAGKLKAIAVTGAERAALLPDVPTVAEAGVPGYEVNVWFGMQMPAGTPKEAIARANQDIVRILRDPEVVKLFRDQGVEVVASTPEAFAALLQKEIPKWSKVVETANIKLD
ncbi:tripartite tricarboxylate transporter substrate binding protein [soil metagenome]